MKCENCGAEFEEGVNFCSNCGHKLTGEDVPAAGEAPVAEETPVEAAPRKLSPGKLAAVIAAAVVLLAALAAMIIWGTGGAAGEPTADPADAPSGTVADPTVPTDSGLDDETHKGTYTVDDETAQAENATVIATMGDAELTNGMLQIYYWLQFYDVASSFGDYAYYYGLDYSLPLDAQLCGSGSTWQQYLLGTALDTWQRFQALALEAEAAGYELTQEQQENLQEIKDTMEITAVENGYASAAEMVMADIGPGGTVEDYNRYLDLYYTGYGYFTYACQDITATDEEIEAYFAEHEEEYAAEGLTKETKTVDVRHVLIKPEGATENANGTVTATDEQWEACRAEAQAMLDAWVAAGATEEGFAELAKEHSVDGNAATGGLYEDVYEGQMVETYNDWCFDASRQAGNYGLVKTDFGYHLMYYVGDELSWPTQAESDVIAEKVNAVLTGILEKYPMEVDYSAIVLGVPEGIVG